ncbi:MAG TPA: IS1634 family transposase [Syntrophothermus lipocalidus]|nr:IS1634 family transposase [Syntrophothermus lipocalidus]
MEIVWYFLCIFVGHFLCILFYRLHQSVDLVFFDTTSVYFEGPTGAQGLCCYGYSKDRRPDRVQVIIGLLIDQDGIPIGHEVLPGNTADVESFLSMLRSCKERFNLRRVVIVGDRGLVSEKTIRAVEEAGYEYIFGVKMRRSREVRDEVLSRAGRYQEVEENLKVKNVVVDDKRCVICYNPQEAKRDAEAREEIIEGLKKKIAAQGIKGLVGNRGYARYLKVNRDAVEINEEAIAQEARYDGKYILKTNTDLTAAEVALAYKQLWLVERAFRELKSNLEIRPMYHWTESRIRGHIMVCFLAFYLEMVLRKRLKEVACDASYTQVIKDLSRVRAKKIVNGKRVAIVRSELCGDAHLAFKAAKMQVPSRVLYENMGHHR